MKILRLLCRRHIRRLRAERARTKAWQLAAENAELTHKLSLLVLSQQRRRMKAQAAEHLRLIEENASLRMALNVLVAYRSIRTPQAEIGRISGTRPYFHAQTAGVTAVSGTADSAHDDAGQSS
jgi:hypothetical protein